MASLEAHQLIQDVDVILEKDAPTESARRRLERLREELQHVEQTGRWPEGGADPWGRFAKEEEQA
ncbi:MAG TPA: hypothetical protein VF160_03530 [Candidatus Dormibacteraeota bacterium]